MQILYHGSYTIVEKPEIREGKYNKDFGKGFYCTILKAQAIKWAKKYSTSMLNVYQYVENKKLKVKEFTLMSDEWLDFIVKSRAGEAHNYDIVIGPMANDQIYNYINEYINGNITREAFWDLAKFSYPTHQIVFCTDDALKTIKFVKSEKINK